MDSSIQCQRSHCPACHAGPDSIWEKRHTKPSQRPPLVESTLGALKRMNSEAVEWTGRKKKATSDPQRFREAQHLQMKGYKVPAFPGSPFLGAQQMKLQPILFSSSLGIIAWYAHQGYKPSHLVPPKGKNVLQPTIRETTGNSGRRPTVGSPFHDA